MGQREERDANAGGGAKGRPASTPGKEERRDGVDPDPILHTLGTLCGRIDPRRVHGLVRLFLEDTARRVEELGEAITLMDLPAVCRMSHELKGSCGQLGVRRMREICESLETAASEKRAEDVRSLMSDVVEEFERARGVLESWAARVQD